MATKRKRPAPGKRVVTKTERSGDEMVTVTVEIETAILDYNEIRKAGYTEIDDDMRAPWDEHDGWEHTATWGQKVFDQERRHFEPTDCPRGKCDNCPHYKEVPHFNPDDRVWCEWDRERVLIEVSRAQVVEWQGEYGQYGPSGEHRQVYEERIAKCRRDAIEQLKYWYTHGYTWYCACLEFGEWSAYCGGIQIEDDADPDTDEHVAEVLDDLAYDVAKQAEKDGYTVINYPERGKQTREEKQRSMLWRRCHYFGFEKPEEYLTWLRGAPIPFGSELGRKRARRNSGGKTR